MDYQQQGTPAFWKQADVVLLCREDACPAHSQLLARSCLLFEELLEVAAEQQRPSPAAPLSVEVPAGIPSVQTVREFLLAVYCPEQTPAILAGLDSAAAYGALLDMAAFARHTQLLAALTRPLSCRSEELGALVQWEFVAWLDVAERHNLAVLRAYCLECLMHLLAAPGCTQREDEPAVGSLDWGGLRQEHLLLLLDGLAGSIRHCTRRTFEHRVRLPAGPITSSRGGLMGSPTFSSASRDLGSPTGAAPAPGTPGGGSSSAGGMQGSRLLEGQAPFVGVPRLELAGSRGSSVMRAAAAGQVMTLQLPQLHETHVQAALPSEGEISAWQQMGDICSSAGVGPAAR